MLSLWVCPWLVLNWKEYFAVDEFILRLILNSPLDSFKYTFRFKYVIEGKVKLNSPSSRSLEAPYAWPPSNSHQAEVSQVNITKFLIISQEYIRQILFLRKLTKIRAGLVSRHQNHTKYANASQFLMFSSSISLLLVLVVVIVKVYT